MKIAVGKKELERILFNIKGVSGGHNMPILEHALFSTKEDHLEVMATNLETGIRVDCPAEVIEQGELALLARKMHEIIKEFPDEKIYINSEEYNKVSIESGAAKFTISSANPKEYPSISFEETKEIFCINSDVLKDMVQKTVFAALKNNRNSALEGVLFEYNDGMIRMVAADGHRLAKIEKQVDIKFDIPEGVLLPRSGLNMLLKFLDKNDVVMFGFKDNNIIFHIGNASIIIRIIEGTFPDYNCMIPKDFPNKITINKNELLDALKRMAVISSFVDFIISSDSITLSAEDSTYGKGAEIIGFKNYIVDPIIIRLNQEYLAEALGTIDNEDLCILFHNSESPIILETLGDKDAVNVIMPVIIR